MEKDITKEVLMDADIDNPASWKTMEAMGGIRKESTLMKNLPDAR